MDIFTKCMQRQNTSLCSVFHLKAITSFWPLHLLLMKVLKWKQEQHEAVNMSFWGRIWLNCALGVVIFTVRSLTFPICQLRFKKSWSSIISSAHRARRPPSWFTPGHWDYSVHSLLRTVISVMSNGSLNQLTGCEILIDSTVEPPADFTEGNTCQVNIIASLLICVSAHTEVSRTITISAFGLQSVFKDGSHCVYT